MSDDNSYAPAHADVRDASPAPRGTRPRWIAVAIALAFVSLVVDALTTLHILVPIHYSGVDREVMLVVGRTGLALSGLLAAMVCRGANWARLLLTPAVARWFKPRR